MVIAFEGAIQFIHFSRSGAIAFEKAKTSIYAWNFETAGDNNLESKIDRISVQSRDPDDEKDGQLSEDGCM